MDFDIMERIGNKKPIVHCMTNYVTVNDVANILLACGASPIMADDEAEVAEIVGISDALVLNIGTLNARTVAAMLMAGQAANAKNIPVVFDPVGVGASKLRYDTARNFLKKIKFTVIRGNASEIACLVNISATNRGVDAADDVNEQTAVNITRTAAAEFNCTIVTTGATDIVSNGRKTVCLKNGVPEMKKITGTGCMLSGMLGAFTAAGDPFEAAVAAALVMGIAGERAFEHNGKIGTGSLRVGIIDEISKMTDAVINKEGKIEYTEP